MSTTSDPVDVGIVGLGGIGHSHADCLVGGPARLVGGMDVDADARTAFADEYGVETYADHEALFEEVDAVFVTTPNAFHEEYAVPALEAGLSVLVEKPLGHTLESAERIAAAAESAPGVCMVGFHNRFKGPVEVLNAYREDGLFGDIQHVDTTYVRRRGVPGRGTWFTDAELAGGGALIDLGVHAIDLALYLLEFPDVVEVSGVTRQTFGDREDYADVAGWGIGEGPFTVEDSVIAQLRTADGATISVDVAWASNRQPEKGIRLRGSDAGALLDLGGDLTVYETETGGEPHHRTTEVEVTDGGGYAAEQAAFIEAIETGEAPTRNTVEQALTVQRLMDAIYRSSDSGEAVRLD